MRSTKADAFYREFGEVRDAIFAGTGPGRFARIANRFGPRRPEVHHYPGDFDAAVTEFRRYPGGLRISGALRLAAGSTVYVRGALTILGSLVVERDALLVVGGGLSCAGAWSEGELAVFEEILARRFFCCAGADSGVYAPSLRTEIFFEEDPANRIDEIHAGIQGREAQAALCDVLGMAPGASNLQRVVHSFR